MKLEMAAEQAIEMTRRNQEKKDREWYIVQSIINSNAKTKSQIADERIETHKREMKVMKALLCGVAGIIVFTLLMAI
jgi:hypothetical protein